MSKLHHRKWSEADRPAPKGIAAPLFYGLTGILMLTNTLAAGAFLMSSDIARLVNGQNAVVLSAYQDRITDLRIEVDRLQSRNYAQAGDLNLQLQELSAQQIVLSEQHALVGALLGKAEELGIDAAALPRDDPEVDVSTLIVTGNPDVDATARSLSAMLDESRSAMNAISSAATDRTDTIIDTLERVGIDVDVPDTALDGVGGPLLPPMDGADETDLAVDANAVLAALTRFAAARGAIDGAPVYTPITEDFRQSSVFGNRRDPFNGARAFHAGLDFAAPSGVPVMSAGAGTVTFAGTRSGYGNTVEITHDNGIMTRYAHLSVILTSSGETVAPGTPIAKVGSSGRSTGPHLHFEVRKADAPLDPKPFLDAGKALSQML